MKVWAVGAVVALAFSPISGVNATGAGKALVTIAYTDAVAPADMQAYVAGIEAYTRCLRERGVTFDEYALEHETGRNTYEVSFYREPMTWSQRAERGSESLPCKATFNAQVNPHVESEHGAVKVEQPEMSHPLAGEKNHPPPLFLHVFYYTLKSGPAARAAFIGAVRKMAAAADRTKWPHYWNTVAIEGGGEGAPDYQIALGGRNWADVGAEPDPSLWKMVADAYGPTEASTIRKSFEDSIAKMSDHFDRYNAELSYIAGK